MPPRNIDISEKEWCTNFKTIGSKVNGNDKLNNLLPKELVRP